MTSSIAFDVIARDKASSTFSRIGKSAETTTQRLVRFGKATGALVGFTALTSAAAGFIKVGGEYSTSLNKIQALSGLTDDKLKAVSSTLESQSGQFAKMGQTTGDAAGGMVELVKAGLSADQALKAVTQTMVLAKAGELDIADASSLVANTLNTFGLKAKDAGKIANYLANAANISSADVSDLAESMKYVAPVAAATGVSLKQTNAILAELSNSGIAASNAGTGFRKFLLSLQAPSGAAAKDLKALNIEVFDASGKMKPLGTVIDILSSKLKGLTDEKRQKILKDVFGLQGISAASVILKNGSRGLETYTKGVGKAGAAQRLAEAQSKGFVGSLRTLKAEVISAAQAEYRQMEPALTTAAKSLEKFLTQMRTGKGAGGQFVDVLKDLAAVAKGALQVLDALPGPVKKFGIEGLIAYGVLRKLTGAFGTMGTSLASPIAKTKQFAAEMTYTETRMASIKTASYALGGALRQLGGVGGMLAVADGAKRSNHALGALEITAGAAAAGFAVGGPLGAALGGTAGYVYALTRAIKGDDKAIKDTLPNIRSYAGTLDDLSGAVTRQTRATILQRLTQSGLIDQLGKMNVSARDAVQAVLGNTAARRRLAAAVDAETDAHKRNQALDTVRKLLGESNAIDQTRLAQLQKNVAIAGTRAELKKAQAALDKFAKTHAAASVSITGIGTVINQLNSVKQLIGEISSSRSKLGSGHHNTGGVGSLLGAGSGGRVGSTSGFNRGDSVSGDAGRATGAVATQMLTVKKALAKFTDKLNTVTSQLAGLKDLKATFLSTFSSDSIFGADLSGGGGISDLIAMQAKQAQQASQLMSDIQKVASMGLSKSLISQLQAQGTSGAEQLHALAGGSVSQIQLLNSLNAQTQASLQGAGLLAGNTVRGGSINADISAASREEQILEKLLKRLEKLHKDDYAVIEIEGEAIVRAIKRRNRRKGVTTAGL
jgi:TP901 family phage tail tape measure protein